MATDAVLADSALRQWQATIDRAGKFFNALTEEQLAQEVAPGKNRLIYLFGHLAAANDALFPLLGVGNRLHPELDVMFLTNPDRAVPFTVSGDDLKRIWTEIHDALWAAFSALTPTEWLQKHTSVSDEDFLKEPHRNRFTVLLSRTTHVGYHLGQTRLGAG